MPLQMERFGHAGGATTSVNDEWCNEVRERFGETFASEAHAGSARDRQQEMLLKAPLDRALRVVAARAVTGIIHACRAADPA